MISRSWYFCGMGEQRTRFLSTSEVVYKVPSDMSMLCYFILGRSDAVVKGIQRKREGDTRNSTRLNQIFRIDIFSYVTPTTPWHPFRLFSLTLTCRSFSTNLYERARTVYCTWTIKSIEFLPNLTRQTECFPQRPTRSRLVY